MSTFSSVIRKPGQKITPKVAPRRNVQRNPARPSTPASATPDGQSANPILLTPDAVIPEPEVELAPAHVSSAAPPSSQPVINVGSLNDDHHIDAVTRRSPSTLTSGEPVQAVQTRAISPPVERNTGRDASRDGIPAVAVSTSPPRAGVKRRLTSEITPAPSEDAAVERDDPATALSQRPSASRKKRQTGADREPTLVFSQGRVTPPPLDRQSPALPRSSSRQRPDDVRDAEVLLQDATSQAAAVSELAISIETHTRSLRPRTTHHIFPTGEQADAADDETSASTTHKARRGKKKPQKGPTAEDQAMAILDAAAVAEGAKGGRWRLSTPSDAEEHQLDPLEVQMGELVKDNKLGKKSETERRMQENWTEIKQRRREDLVRRREAAAQGRQGRQTLSSNLDANVPVQDQVAHPEMMVVNGVITVTAESREVVFSERVGQVVQEDAAVALEDDRIFKYVNQGTIGKYAGLRRGTRWDDESTELFYKGLRMFGTDFMMIANMFPGMTRKQIKDKYVREERYNLVRVRENLRARQTVGLEEYARMTDQQFEDPRKIYEEIEAEEKRLREEDEQRRIQEGFSHGEADTILPSRERDTVEAEDLGEEERRGVDGEAWAPDARVIAAADAVVGAAVMPKKRQRKPRDPTKARQPKKGRKPLEGVEERIGPIDEVER